MLTMYLFFKGLHVTAASPTFNLRKVELTPLEQRKLTFDSHAMVSELQRSGEKNQIASSVSSLDEESHQWRSPL